MFAPERETDSAANPATRLKHKTHIDSRPSNRSVFPGATNSSINEKLLVWYRYRFARPERIGAFFCFAARNLQLIQQCLAGSDRRAQHLGTRLERKIKPERLWYVLNRREIQH